MGIIEIYSFEGIKTSFSYYLKVMLSGFYLSVRSLSRVQLFATPWNEYARPPCPSPTPGVYSNLCPLSW